MDAAIVLDGYLEEASVPGDQHGTTARFRLTVSPTDERTDEMVLPCSVTDPVMSHAVLHDLAVGDQLRVTGYLRLPRTPDEPLTLATTRLEVLQTAPLLGDPAPGHAAAAIEQYGPYLCYLAPGTDQIPIWTDAGTWVGTADGPTDIEARIAAWEQTTRNP